MYVAACYFSYLAISVVLTMWVARTLYRSGRVFLLDAFQGNEALADSVNHLLVVGFYLINVGYIVLALKTTSALSTMREMIELESAKIGTVLLILGIMHAFNILVLSGMRTPGHMRRGGWQGIRERSAGLQEAQKSCRPRAFGGLQILRARGQLNREPTGTKTRPA